MSAVPMPLAAHALESARVADEVLVLQGRTLRSGEGRGPRFGDDRWNLQAAHHTPNANTAALVIRFDRIPDARWRITAKEYAYARLTGPVEGAAGLPTPLTIAKEVLALRRLFAHLSIHHPGMRLADIDDDLILDGFLTAATAGTSARWRAQDRARIAWTLTLLYRIGERLTHDRLTHLPFGGRRASQVAGRRPPVENYTPRIPPEVLAPYLRGALFYVQTAAADILAAIGERDRQILAPRRHGVTATLRRLDAFVDQRRREGRGLPTESGWNPGTADPKRRHGLGINLTLIAALIGVQQQCLRFPPVRHLAFVVESWRSIRGFVGCVGSGSSGTARYTTGSAASR